MNFNTTILNKIATILRDIGRLECTQKAGILDTENTKSTSLNLRNLRFSPNEVSAIAEALQYKKSGQPKINSYIL